MSASLNFDHCPLCQKLTQRSVEVDFLHDGFDFFKVFKSPLNEQFIGSVMVVYTRHVREQFQISNIDRGNFNADFVDLQKAVLKATKADRLNVVKFGNVCEHLHWHIVPRYNNEVYGQKTPWELTLFSRQELFRKTDDLFSVQFTTDIFESILVQWQRERQKRRPAYFGSSLFLRHKNIELRNRWENESIINMIADCRAQPQNWEVLLMQRNYLDYAWDSVGGGADAHEFPSQCNIREVREELGWDIGECVEVTRQWNRGVLRGFVYVAKPMFENWTADSPRRIACDEVKDVRYFDIFELSVDERFKDSVTGRIKALINGESDFSCEGI